MLVAVDPELVSAQTVLPLHAVPLPFPEPVLLNLQYVQHRHLAVPVQTASADCRLLILAWTRHPHALTQLSPVDLQIQAAAPDWAHLAPHLVD